MRALSDYWWITLIRGIIAVIFGIAAIVWPTITLAILLTIFGIFMLIEGIITFISAFQATREETSWFWLVIEGIVDFIIGVAVFAVPGITAVALLYFIAAWAIIAGAIKVITALQNRQEVSGVWLYGLGGIISIIFGLAVLINPGIGAVAIVVAIGLFAISIGVLNFAFSFMLRDWQQNAPKKSAKKAA